jgi:hypothetical protein
MAGLVPAIHDFLDAKKTPAGFMPAGESLLCEEEKMPRGKSERQNE